MAIVGTMRGAEIRARRKAIWYAVGKLTTDAATSITATIKRMQATETGKMDKSPVSGPLADQQRVLGEPDGRQKTEK